MIEAWSSLVRLLPFEWAQYTFMHHALLAALVSAPVFGLLGTLIVNQRLAFFSDAIGHSALTGVALGATFGLGDPQWAMLPLAVAVAGAITAGQHYARASSDTVVSVLMSAAIAAGIVLIGRGGGFGEAQRLLFGDSLSLRADHLPPLVACAALTVGLLAWRYHQVLLVGLNPSLAHSRGLPVFWIRTGFTVAVALVVTVNVQWVGILVINGLLVIPAAAARSLARTTAGYVAWSVALAWVASVGGLLLSYAANTATSATMVLTAAAGFLLAVVVGRSMRR